MCMKKYAHFSVGVVAGLLLAVTSISFAAGVRFSDIRTGIWFEKSVKNMVDIGVVRGYPDGTFGPEKQVSRAEVAVMLDRFKLYVDARVDGKPVPGPLAVEVPAPVVAASSASANCSAFAYPQTKQVVVSTVAQLKDAIVQANTEGNLTILLKNGTYTLDAFLWLRGNNVTIRSESGNRDDVIIRGAGMNGGVSHVLQIEGDNALVANLTVGWVANHPIQIHGELDADNTVIHNVRFADGREQLLKVSYNADEMNVRSDNGVVECSLFEYTAGIGPQYYIGGVDAHNAKNWIVRDNVFKNIRSPEEELAEHAVHFWSSSEGTIVERNIIINADRGIGFGLGDRGHVGGIIRNNMIYHDVTRGDVGIVLENANGTKVLNNTIFFDNDYKNAIEYRFVGSGNVEIKNNLTNKVIAARDGATGVVLGNVTNAVRDWFVNPSSGDLFLKNGVTSSAGVVQ